MSWFDTTKGLASLAKTALKEAQKQIDKALDIQDDAIHVSMVNSTEATKRATTAIGKKVVLPGGVAREKSKTEPSTPNVETKNIVTQLSNDGNAMSASNWGSFTGSFFENPKANEMITTPPKASSGSLPSVVPISTTSTTPMSDKRQSLISNSDSVELLSTPSSPVSDLASPSDGGANSSTSVELITASATSEVVTSESISSLPESIVIISSTETCDEDEDDDSMSFNTVLDDTLTGSVDITAISTHIQDGMEVSKESVVDMNMVTRLSHSGSSTNSSAKIVALTEDVPYETQTVNSDSTQSFEYIQMQTSSIHGSAKDDKFDLIKLASQSYCSPPNSNDELETTTSSDIEILSNPNGDSSSTNSITRASPLKLKKCSSSQTMKPLTTLPTSKGHHREPSEISILSEDSQSELDKLLHRISELNEILEAREMRLLQSERHNATLQERVNEIQASMDALNLGASNLDSAEEYTQRLSALEKKFQASIRERDALRIQLKALKTELQDKIPKGDMAQVVAESNSMVSELKQEGEKLSKEILQQSNIIKKLRAKEKSSDILLKKNKEEIAELQEELERSKKTLNAKEDVERSQIEAVHKMSSEKRKLDEENAQYRSKIEDIELKLGTVQTSLDACKGELQHRNKLHSDLTRTAEEVSAAKKEKEITKAENNEMMMQLNELREKLRNTEQSMTKREQQLREENRELVRRLEESELRVETLTQEMSLTTMPLMRQLESLQNTLNQRSNNWKKEEKSLLEKYESARNRLETLENIEVSYKSKVDSMTSMYSGLEEKLTLSLMQEQKSKMAQQQCELDFNLKETTLNTQILQQNEKLTELKTNIETLEKLKEILEDKLQSKNDEKIHTGCGTDDITHRELSTAALHEHTTAHLQQQRAHSPTNSFGRSSLEDTMGGSIDWQADDFDCISNSGRQAGTAIVHGTYVNFMANNTTTLEHLQSLLKQRDGEMTHLQWEHSRLIAERGILNDEISNLTLEIENIKEKMQSLELVEKNFEELQHRYDALLQMYGEKVERTEELELDLVELKEAYKTQIDELLAKPSSS